VSSTSNETIAPAWFAARIALVVLMLLLSYWTGEPGAFFMYQGF
jgi:hypothetical protein